MPNAVVSAGQEDHRIRVARARRERMRARLLNAVLSVYPSDNTSGPALIDDVIRAAGISRGTFYKYFPSLEDAVAQLGTKLADEMAEVYTSILDVCPGAIDRVATAVQVGLLRAVAEPRWGMFVAHADLLGRGDHPALTGMEASLRLGVASGEFRFASMDAAVDHAKGVMIEGIRRLIRGEGPPDYIPQTTAMLLCGLGVTRGPAQRKSATVYRRLLDKGPHLSELWLRMPGDLGDEPKRKLSTEQGADGQRGLTDRAAVSS